MNLRLINQIRFLLLPSTAFGESLHMVGREGIEPTRTKMISDLQSDPAPYGTTCPYNSNLTYLNLACTSLHFMNNSINTMKNSRISSTIRPTRDITFISKVREYLRIAPKPRLSTPTPTRLAV